MSRYLRYLRIAFSATCLIACVLVIALWVRSYWVWDGVTKQAGPKYIYHVASYRGEFGVARLAAADAIDLDGSQLLSFGWNCVWRSDIPQLASGNTITVWGQKRPYALIPFAVVHYGLVFIPFAALAAAPWLRWSNRFSLRTLLVATTLVAVVLGLIMWAASK
jgi:hypothetical protein